MSEKFTPAQMERLREFLRWFAETILKPQHHELVVKSTVINMLRMAYPDRAPTESLAPIIDAALAAIRAKPEFQAAIHAEFQQFLEKLMQSFSERIPDSGSEDLKWLRDWKPTGFVN
jgi:hypothetical protein